MLDSHSFINWRKHSAKKSRVQNVTWSNDDILTLPWQETYMINEIPDDDSWNTFATKSKKELEDIFIEWGVPKEGGLHYMSIRPKLTIRLSSLLNPFELMKFNYNFLKLTPGCSLMWHFDTYATFVKFNNINESEASNVCRTVVMLEDWDRGQILQVGNEVYSHWYAGDTYTWKGDTWHGMSNFGPSDCIISQITFLDEHDRYTQ